MTGVTFPAFMRSCMTVRSSLFGLARTPNIFRLPNLDNTGVAKERAKGPIIHRPVDPPTETYLPVGIKMRLHANSEWFPTESKIRS